MFLFDEFSAVKFVQENMIFIVSNSNSLKYSYDIEKGSWEKYYDYIHITSKNYDDVSKEEIMNAMGNKFPTKETDFTRLCNLYDLRFDDLLSLLTEDYPHYTSDYDIYGYIYILIDCSRYEQKTYSLINEVLRNATKLNQSKEEVCSELQKIGLNVLGKDIFKREINIYDYHYGSSYFWIRPVRMVDYDCDNNSQPISMIGYGISIEIDDVVYYLSPFLIKYFDNDLYANKCRSIYEDGFDEFEENYYTAESIRLMLDDIKDTVDALTHNRTNEYTDRIIDEISRGYNDCQSKEPSIMEIVIDF